MLDATSRLAKRVAETRLAARVCTANSLRYCVCLFSLQEIIRFRLEHEFRIAELAHFRKIETRQFRLYRDSVPDEIFEQEIDHETQRENEADQGGDTDELRRKLARIPVEQSGHGTSYTVPCSSVVARAIREKPHRQPTPQPIGAMDRNRTDGIVNLQHILDKAAAEDNEDTGNQTNDAGADRAHETAGSRNRYESGEKAVAAHRGVDFAVLHPHVKHGSESPGATGEHRVHGDGADAKITGRRSAESAPRVKPEPSESENEATNQYGRNVVANDCIARSVAVEFSDPWPNDQANGECRYSSDCVHYARPCEIAVTFSEPEVRAELRKPASAPSPVAIQWIGDCAHDAGGNCES